MTVQNMKKKSIGIIAASALLIFVFCAVFNLFFPLSIRHFSLNDYSYTMYEYTLYDPPYCNVGRIDNRFDAVNAARHIFHDFKGDPLNGYHWDVYFDEENNCWYLKGSIWAGYFSRYNPFYGMCGGGADDIITSDGDVIALWIEV